MYKKKIQVRFLFDQPLKLDPPILRTTTNGWPCFVQESDGGHRALILIVGWSEPHAKEPASKTFSWSRTLWILILCGAGIVFHAERWSHLKNSEPFDVTTHDPSGLHVTGIHRCEMFDRSLLHCIIWIFSSFLWTLRSSRKTRYLTPVPWLPILTLCIISCCCSDPPFVKLFIDRKKTSLSLFVMGSPGLFSIFQSDARNIPCPWKGFFHWIEIGGVLGISVDCLAVQASRRLLFAS